MRGAEHLGGGVCGAELTRIRPEQEGQRAIARLVVAGREVDGRLQLHAVLAAVLHHFALHAGELRCGVREPRELLRRDTTHEVAQEIIRRLTRGLAPREEPLAAIIHHIDDRLVVGRGAAEETLGLAAREVDAIDERTVALRRCAIAP